MNNRYREYRNQEPKVIAIAKVQERNTLPIELYAGVGVALALLSLNLILA